MPETIDVSKYNEAESYFGLTNCFNLAGYLLTNGNMLDFSGRHCGNITPTCREVDHKQINEVFKYMGQNREAEIFFMNAGNIRLVPEINGIDISKEPNEEQYSRLYDIINTSHDEFIVDISSETGTSIKSMLFKEKTCSSAIITSIKNYFKETQKAS